MTYVSMGRYSEIGITTVRAWIDTISTITGTTITITDVDNYLYSPGYGNGAMVYLGWNALTSSINSTNKDKICNITSVTAGSNQIVVDVAYTGWTAGDQVAICPRPLTYLCVQSESIKEAVNWDDTECLQAWEPTYHTPLTLDTGGDLGVFVGSESTSLDYVLSAAMGSTTHSGTTHTHIPGATCAGLTVYIMRGNHVSLHMYGGMGVDTLTLDQPAGGSATGRAALTGGFGVQEVGGAGKVFSTGANNFWNPPTTVADPKRMGFRHLVVSKATTPRTYAESGSITIARNPSAERRLGDAYSFDPQSGKFMVTGNLVQWFENDDEMLAWRGGYAKMAMADPTPFDLQYKWSGTATTGTYLQVDAYDVVWRDDAAPIAAGRIKETLTWQAKYKSAAGMSIKIIYSNNTTCPALV